MLNVQKGSKGPCTLYPYNLITMMHIHSFILQLLNACLGESTVIGYLEGRGMISEWFLSLRILKFNGVRKELIKQNGKEVSVKSYREHLEDRVTMPRD